MAELSKRRGSLLSVLEKDGDPGSKAPFNFNNFNSVWATIAFFKTVLCSPASVTTGKAAESMPGL